MVIWLGGGIAPQYIYIYYKDSARTIELESCSTNNLNITCQKYYNFESNKNVNKDT